MSVQYNCLAPGINKNIPIEIIIQQLVVDISTSSTRDRNFKGFQQFISKLIEINITDCITKIWINGSFVSKKIDPNDVDMIFFLDATHPACQIILDNKKLLREIGIPLYCDTYYVVDYETIPSGNDEIKSKFEYQKKYWMGQFCFDRNEIIKGIIELKMSDLL